jgi:hypothetical protein
VLFKLSVPLETKLVGLVHDVAMRIGHERGLPARDAESIARAVDEAVTEAMLQPVPGGRVDLRFHCDDLQMEIGVFYPAPPGLSARGRALRPRAGAGEATAGSEQLVEQGIVHHRLTRRLPKPCRRKQ